MDMHMQMTFYWGSDVTLWFDGWQTGGSVHRFAFVLLSLFGLALGQEYLHAYRGKLGHDRISTGRRALSSALYALQVLCSYLLMLAVMTYNGGVVVIVILGMGVGRFLFGATTSGPLIANQANGGVGAATSDGGYAPIPEHGVSSGSAAAEPADLCCPN